jgi:hypothetical protein
MQMSASRPKGMWADTLLTSRLADRARAVELKRVEMMGPGRRRIDMDGLAENVEDTQAEASWRIAARRPNGTRRCKALGKAELGGLARRGRGSPQGRHRRAGTANKMTELHRTYRRHLTRRRRCAERAVCACARCARVRGVRVQAAANRAARRIPGTPAPAINGASVQPDPEGTSPQFAARRISEPILLQRPSSSLLPKGTPTSQCRT